MTHLILTTYSTDTNFFPDKEQDGEQDDLRRVHAKEASRLRPKEDVGPDPVVLWLLQKGESVNVYHLREIVMIMIGQL